MKTCKVTFQTLAMEMDKGLSSYVLLFWRQLRSVNFPKEHKIFVV